MRYILHPEWTPIVAALTQVTGVITNCWVCGVIVSDLEAILLLPVFRVLTLKTRP
jgi:hypothetical protein